MSEPVRVELTPRKVPVSPDVQAQRAAVVERMGNLGQIDPSTGAIPDAVQDGWTARINGVEIPVTAYGVEPSDDGRALVSLLIPADVFSVGAGAAAAQPVPAPKSADAPHPVSTWGAPGQPDPRQGLPGWKPEVPSV